MSTPLRHNCISGIYVLTTPTFAASNLMRAILRPILPTALGKNRHSSSPYSLVIKKRLVKGCQNGFVRKFAKTKNF